MKRTFIAVRAEAGEKLKEMAIALRSDLRNDNIKWVDINNMHITLVFLGDTSDDLISHVTTILQERCSGFSAFNFTIKGLGLFRSIHDPRVIWAGIDAPEEFSDLHMTISQGLSAIGIKPDEHRFKPHLTLGRVNRLKNIDTLKRMIEKYENQIFQTVSVSEVVFIESILQPSGPLYKPMFVCKLLQK
jgi:2'-5' RNA ligase